MRASRGKPLAPTAGNAQQQYLAGARLLWLESPSNPGLEVCDIAALVAAAHDAGALVAVDNTTPTVLGQQPLALGADFVTNPMRKRRGLYLSRPGATTDSQ